MQSAIFKIGCFITGIESGKPTALIVGKNVFYVFFEATVFPGFFKFRPLLFFSKKRVPLYPNYSGFYVNLVSKRYMSDVKLTFLQNLENICFLMNPGSLITVRLPKYTWGWIAA